jgi:hypothetical protein
MSVDACPTDDLVGTCTTTQEAGGVSVTSTAYYYPPATPELVMTICSGSGGTYQDPGAALDGSTPRPDAGSAPPTDQLDLLLVSDDSRGMEWKQAALAELLPQMIERLSSGDLDGDGSPDRAPFTSIQLGVVTADMGVGSASVPTCNLMGDDGILQTTSRATGCSATYPAILSWSTRQSPGSVGSDFACVAQTGSDGCGFEQSLESPLKALSPSSATDWTGPDYAAPAFRGSPHGDRENAGFVRRDSMLAVMIFTDEDDCSAEDIEIYDPESTTYTGGLNLRCWVYDDEALHPVQRYVDGLLQLRRYPSRLAFFVMAGVPEDLVPEPGAPIPWDTLVGDPSVRDPRMVVQYASSGTDLQRSCTDAYPPVRLVETARALEARGARVTVGSLCQSSSASSLWPSLTSFLVSLR